jgi:F0F1-type ATP synthase gamma subunit
MITSRTKTAILKDAAAAWHPPQIFSGAAGKRSSEFQGARMTAMDNATRNAGEMIDKLTCSTTAHVRPRSPTN